MAENHTNTNTRPSMHHPRIDLLGKRFGRLTVLSLGKRSVTSYRRDYLWLCECDCGSLPEVLGSQLRNGGVRSCGCLRREVERQPKASWMQATHGMSGTRTYIVWSAMRDRCLNPKHADYHNYGGRGINICERWMAAFQNFYDDMGEAPEGMSIERIDNNCGYSAENCRWATMKEQSNNTRRNSLLTYREETHTITQWSELLGIARHVLYKRLVSGWSIERILTSPLDIRKSNKKGQHGTTL